MKKEKGTAQCPRCARTISTFNGIFTLHNDGTSEYVCPMSKQHVPYRADQNSPNDFVGRAYLVANLAAAVQDEDPSVVWDYLTATPALELQKLLMIALAGLPIDQTVGEMFAWVANLPVAAAPAPDATDREETAAA